VRTYPETVRWEMMKNHLRRPKAHPTTGAAAARQQETAVVN